MSREIFRFGHEAMATHFQLLLPHEDKLLANGAAQAVFNDIDQLEKELSRFVPYSDIATLNRADVGEPIPVQAACMDCLMFGKMVWESTQGAFDVTIGPLFRLLCEPDGTPAKPTKAQRAEAASKVGFQHLEIDPDAMTVTKHAPGMSIDLGAIGKGYALDQAAMTLLNDHEINDALLNAGDSTVLAFGSMPGRDGWQVRAGHEVVTLHDQALSGTGFQHKGAHIIDPRTHRAVDVSRHLRWSIAPNATLADALSTAFMVMTQKEITAFLSNHPDVRALLS